MKSDKDLVSVIITSYGDPRKLSRAIDSVLAQTYEEYEVIVVDDNDPGTKYRAMTEAVMEKYGNEKVKYIKHPKNRNGSAARNTGINNSKGSYIAFLDNDDVYLPKKLEKSVDFLKNNEQYGGVLTGVVICAFNVINNVVEQIDTQGLVFNILTGKADIGTGSNMFFRKETVDTIGFFDDRFTRFQDLEYVLRVRDKFDIGFIKDKLIIKDGDGRNVPSYQKMVYNDTLFLEKFSDIIKAFDKSQRKQIINYHYSERLRYAVECFGTNEDVKKEAENVRRIRNLTDDESAQLKHLERIRFTKKIKKKLKSDQRVQIFYSKINKIRKANINKQYSEYLKYLDN